MTSKEVIFAVDEQTLERTGGVFEYASNTVDYVQAKFTLGNGWDGLDVIRAIWTGAGHTIATILTDGECEVPHEVLSAVGPVKVNLAGSVFEDETLTDRITTYPITALIVTKAALVDDTATPTPTEFEQFVARVEDAASKVDGAEEAAERAEDAADRAEEAASTADKVKNMTVEAETLPAGSEATVTKTETEGELTLEFGIPKGDTGAKGDTGETGQRGSGILSITHAPTPYTTPVGDFTPTYRFSLATVLADSGFDEVIVGDRLLRINYSVQPLYHVGAVDSDYVYTTAPNELRGPQGPAGQDGSDGAPGVDGYSPTVSITDITGGKRITITDKTGDHTADIMNGADGTDGTDGATFTPSVSSAGVISWTNDGGKQNPPAVDIVAAVLAALPTWQGGAY